VRALLVAGQASGVRPSSEGAMLNCVALARLIIRYMLALLRFAAAWLNGGWSGGWRTIPGHHAVTLTAVLWVSLTERNKADSAPASPLDR